MIDCRDPRQKPIFDPFDAVLTTETKAKLLESWAGPMRHVFLEEMPVDILSGEFDPDLGRPTKELYSMAGLILIKEFKNWTKEEAVEAYRYSLNVHYALNLEPVVQKLSVRTLERYEKIFVEHNLAAEILGRITLRLVKELGLRIDKQRLDSTHHYSDMAHYGRTRLMVVAIRRFLTQVKRHDKAGYEALDEELRKRYEGGVHRFFGGKSRTLDGEKKRRLRQQVAEDLYALVVHFGKDERHCRRSTYLMMERVLHEQCEIEEGKVKVRKKLSGNVVQNPSDPDATYDKHKGKGYQTQLSETCHPENEVQIITSCLPQTAVDSDSAALPEVLEDLEKKDLLPKEILADCGYGSDENVEICEKKGVELVSPTQAGATAMTAIEDEEREKVEEKVYSLNIDDFVVEESTEKVLRCPAGHTPVSSELNPTNGKVRTVMPASACSQCPFFGECPVYLAKGEYRLVHRRRVRRLAGRRREELTEAFRERYRLRAGIESTNSALKRKLGLGRLRVRGRPRVFHAVYCKIAGWNILRAAVSSKMRKLVAQKAKSAFGLSLDALFRPIFGLWAAQGGSETPIYAPETLSWAPVRKFPLLPSTPIPVRA